MGKGSIEKILPAVRALIAEKLVKDFDFSKVEAAKALNLTPSAITQYLKGIRASKVAQLLREGEGYRLIIENLTKKVAEDYSRDGSSTKITAILDVAYQILALMSGEKIEVQEVKKRGEGEDKKERWLKLLRARLQAEHLAAQRNMSMALWAKNDLVKSLFRQIASDSLRHADIVSSLISHIEKGEREIRLEAPNKREVEQILKEEEEATEVPLDELKDSRDEVIKLLIESIESDEEKHLKLLRGLVSLGKR